MEIQRNEQPNDTMKKSLVFTYEDDQNSQVLCINLTEKDDNISYQKPKRLEINKHTRTISQNFQKTLQIEASRDLKNIGQFNKISEDPIIIQQTPGILQDQVLAISQLENSDDNFNDSELCMKDIDFDPISLDNIKNNNQQTFLQQICLSQVKKSFSQVIEQENSFQSMQKQENISNQEQFTPDEFNEQYTMQKKSLDSFQSQKQEMNSFQQIQNLFLTILQQPESQFRFIPEPIRSKPKYFKNNICNPPDFMEKVFSRCPTTSSLIQKTQRIIQFQQNPFDRIQDKLKQDNQIKFLKKNSIFTKNNK